MAQPTFILRSDSGELDSSTVVSFHGSETISGLYQFDVVIKIPTSTVVDLDAVLNAEAVFTLEHNGTAYKRHGLLRSFEMQQTAGNYSYYSASLVPRVWRLSLYPTNEVFVGPDFLTVDGIIDTVLTRGGFSSGNDFDVSGLTATYPERDYTCQFGETDLAFMSRLMERDGIWHYFEQGADAELLVVRDDADYPALASDAIFAATPDDNNRYTSIQSWVCRKQRLPKEVVLRDYNYTQPSLDVSGTAQVDPDGLGSVFVYGDNFSTAEEGARLARVRAEELACRKTLFHGQGAIPAFTAGHTFALTGNPAQGGAWNDLNYLLLAVTHEGENLDNPVSAATNRPRYSNSFTAIPASLQFRAERTTAKPRFDGTMTAVVYAESATATLAEVNETGHYRVRLPFDRAGSDGEKASHWIRMAQPYAGEEQGMYFPLKANTEVLLTFINGDPDRPIIAGAVPNGANLSLLNSNTSNQATIATPDLLRVKSLKGYHKHVETDGWRDKAGFEDHDFTVMKDGAQSDGAMAATDEVSGDYLVERRYGDKYVWVDGDTFTWDNERNYSFGNDYEELHEGLDHVGQTGIGVKPIATRYTITPYTGSFVDDPEKEIFEIPALGKDRESDEGLTEKNWGNKFEYHWGSAYNWSGGPGPGGSCRTFNYGNGYTENLLEIAQGDFASKYASTKHDSWKSESRIDPAKATIEKTYGATYSYQNGFTYEVHEGDSRSETYGNSNETINGNQKSFVVGNQDSITHGGTSEMVMGGVSSMFLGASNELKLSGENSIVGGLKNEIFLGISSSIFLGIEIELKLGGAMEFGGTANMRATPTDMEAMATKLEAHATAINSAATKIDTCATKINSLITELDASTISIQTGALKLLG